MKGQMQQHQRFTAHDMLQVGLICETLGPVISLTLQRVKIFDIYFCYSVTNEKIAISHLWHAMEPQTMYRLMAMVQVAE